MQIATLIERCRGLEDPTLSELIAQLTETELDDATRPLLRAPEERAHRPLPYGRRVLLNSPEVEIMIACWADGVWCAPHTHGGSVGGVKVLQGAAQHRVWSVTNGQMRIQHEEELSAGDILSCGSEMIHSMCGRELITLHAYARAIDHMVVYDPELRRTFVVDGGEGAWVPDSAGVRVVHPGYRAPSELA